MSAPALPLEVPARAVVRPAAKREAAWSVHQVMRALGSLKLTVVLFALGIFVVYVGTVAQQEEEIWQVVRHYFHAWVMWVKVDTLFPRVFFPFLPALPTWRFPAPGGLVVGSLMALNLLAAHGWRFTIQARGTRLYAGLAVLLAGLLTGLLIIWAGHNDRGIQAKPPFTWDTFWRWFLASAGLLWLAAAAAYGQWGVLGLRRRRLETGQLPWVDRVLSAVAAVLLLAVGGLIVWGAVRSARPSDEALRVVWQLIQGGLAGLVLLVGCMLVFRQRGGIVLLHLGIGLLMFNELWVSQNARERQVFLYEGETTNYLRDIRTVELAFVARSADGEEEHVVIPRDLLIANSQKNQPLVEAALKAQQPLDKLPLEYLDHPLLPVKLAVLTYYRNASVVSRDPGELTPATAGRGLQEKLIENTPARGTDTEGRVDLAGAYVRLVDKATEKDLGTYLLSQLASEQRDPERFAERLRVQDKTYELYLRFKREYKPYRLALVDVRKDDYLASDTPRNYSSDVRIVDPEAGVDTTVHIKMNDPLRYRNDTFYQSGYHFTPEGEATTLQVVFNRGWMIPYVASMVVVIGMVAHFLSTVTRFVRRREEEEVLQPAEASRVARRKARSVREPVAGGVWSRWGVPLLVLGLFGLTLARVARPPQPAPDQFDLIRFGRLPVAHLGRIKPIDTLARNTVRALTINSESAKTPEGDRIPAVQWLLEVISGTERSTKMPVIRIDSREVRQIFDLPERPRFAYCVEDLQPHIRDFERQVEAAMKTPADQRSVVQQRVLELDQRLRLYLTLVRAFTPPDLPDLPTEEEVRTNPNAIRQFRDAFLDMMGQTQQMISQTKAPRVIPLAQSSDADPEQVWQAYPVAFARASLLAQMGQSPDEGTLALNGMIGAYRRGDARKFNEELTRYEHYLKQVRPPLWHEGKVALEAYFNYVSPFFVAMLFYLAAFLLAVLGWLFRARPLQAGALTLIVLTFLLHTAALAARLYISGRPPVTNLYSSAVFIGWAAVLLGLIIEAIFRLGLGNIVASVAGFATLIIAYFLSAGGDTITVLQAVLDTQFWLALHVTCITLGYAATYFAGLFGVLYVVCGLLTPWLDATMRREIGRIIYGITCFAILFSFYGTVLGGLWADDSWGRFWGWDPKENGALMIVLWNALLLHARWDRLVADRGMAVLAVGGNLVTSWSWFGVNQLGIGLHSYGFTSGVALALLLFGLSQLLLIGLGLLPTRLWRSFQADSPASPLLRSV
jgi:ABC-type transport system involved in cytochrome c biogenesis permease subunit